MKIIKKLPARAKLYHQVKIDEKFTLCYFLVPGSSRVYVQIIGNALDTRNAKVVGGFVYSFTQRELEK